MNTLLNTLSPKMLFDRFAAEESGMGTVEVVLILVVLIGLVIIFRDSMRTLLEALLKTVSSQAQSVNISK